MQQKSTEILGCEEEEGRKCNMIVGTRAVKRILAAQNTDVPEKSPKESR